MSPPSQDTVDEGSVSSSADKSLQSSDHISSDGDNNSSENDTSGNKMDNIRKEISQKESQSVLKLKFIVLLLLTIVAIAVSVTVYFVTSKAEEEEFRSQYEGAASKIVETFDTIMVRLGAISAVAMGATIEGLDNIETTRWPFVTMSSFQQRSATARLLSDTQFVQVLPKVRTRDKHAWELYVVSDAKKWIEEGLEFQEHWDLNRFEYKPPPMSQVLMTNYTSKPIFYQNEKGEVINERGPGPYLPRWEMSPVLKKRPINENLLRYEENDMANVILEEGVAAFGGFESSEPGDYTSDNYKTAFFATLKSIRAGENTYYIGAAHASLFLPIFDNFSTNRTVVGVTKAIINWKNYLQYILPDTVKGIDVILRNSCGGAYTFQVRGPDVEGIGFGDHHNGIFAKYMREASLRGKTITDGTKTGIPLDEKRCFYLIEVYPTQEFYESHRTSTPALITFAVAAVSLLTICIFLVYDRFVEKRQTKVLNQAAASTAIVSSLFPKQIQERLMQQQQDNDQRKGGPKSFMKDGKKTTCGAAGSQMAADFFPYCTVLFADVSGFTAWSSTREPSQVFILLQTLFQGFDSIAKKRKVFKVETIGDCYVAVTGLPDPQAHHALIMARFAFECKQKMRKMTRDLEVTLGPGTGDLCLRVGLHSGAVTAGVLQGENTRFQLFGDTVNIASKMESSGIRDRIHISQKTANLLIEGGKAHWVKLREDATEIKGKGPMKTYWLSPGSKRGSSAASSSNPDSKSESEYSSREGEDNATSVSDVKRERMVDWMVELLLERIRKMVATRLQVGKTVSQEISYTAPEGLICLDEVKEIIPMSEFTCTKSDVGEVDKDIIPEDIVADLRTYVSTLASTYHDNPFHNFEHACHVTMSVNKLLMRITTKEIKDDDLQSSCYTQNLCSDHLVAFAIVFSGLIHDVDHRGCSNMQLIKEQPKLGELYREKSVAEQNSLDLSWKVLMEDRFSKLRSAIFANQEELLRFRQIVVNSVLATDIFDKELSDLRKARWVKAFSDDVDESEAEHLDRKATIVIEHIIQASDVSHTMQHWHVYRKWNTCLFKELYRAYKAGRMGVDPSTFWYKGELGFFDNYIIPLAGKLKDCNVFGVSSDEFLNYAVCNRAEWEERGQGVVEELVKEITQELADAEDDEKLEKAAEETEAATTAQ